MLWAYGMQCMEDSRSTKLTVHWTTDKKRHWVSEYRVSTAV